MFKTKKYTAIIKKEKNSDYGIIFPDFLGCVSVGKTLEEAKNMAEEALQFHIDEMLAKIEAVFLLKRLGKRQFWFD
ncbi:MAG: type II toxin-antitoxin system HicB family antitoxin [Pseudomonadota bacterium]